MNNIQVPEGLEEQDSDVESNLATHIYLNAWTIKQLVKVVGLETGHCAQDANEEEAVNVAYEIRAFISA